MAEIESDGEIEFHPRHVGGGEHVDIRGGKTNQHEHSEEESDSAADQILSPDFPRVFPGPEINRENAGYERTRRCETGNRYTVGSTPLVRPDKYNGDGDWESFIGHFEICAELGGWSSRVMTLTLASCLQGQARIFYMNLSNSQKNSYAELVKQLSQRFGYAREKLMWASRLEAKQRQNGETILSFGDDIRRLTQRAHADLDPYAQEAIALNQLLKSVSPDMKYRCIAGHCSTVAQAVEIIELYEGVVGNDARQKKNVIRMVKDEQDSQTSFQDTVTSGLSELRVTVDKVISRIEKLERREVTPKTNHKKACYGCNSTDHMVNQCPWKRDNSRMQQQRPGFKKFNETQKSLN